MFGSCERSLNTFSLEEDSVAPLFPQQQPPSNQIQMDLSQVPFEIEI